MNDFDLEAARQSGRQAANNWPHDTRDKHGERTGDSTLSNCLIERELAEAFAKLSPELRSMMTNAECAVFMGAMRGAGADYQQDFRLSDVETREYILGFLERMNELPRDSMFAL